MTARRIPQRGGIHLPNEKAGAPRTIVALISTAGMLRQHTQDRVERHGASSADDDRSLLMSVVSRARGADASARCAVCGLTECVLHIGGI